VRILLPPSETKTVGGSGRPIDGRADAGPLATPRAAVREALRTLLDGDAASATKSLLLPAGVAREALAANAVVTRAPTCVALRRYAGVLYEGLGFGTLSPQARGVAGRSILICSGLFGVVRGDEPVPPYRVPAQATLPGLGIVGTYWRSVLRTVLPPMLGRGLVIDLRSSDYAAMWRPAPELASRVLTVRVLSPAPRGGHAVQSYASKLAKGRLAAALVARAAAGESVEAVDDVVTAWADCPGSAGAAPGPRHVDLYTV
jgi:cytoplasmic iron level regulating protein YaaA (DUF328/UPF0246 family)